VRDHITKLIAEGVVRLRIFNTTQLNNPTAKIVQNSGENSELHGITFECSMEKAMTFDSMFEMEQTFSKNVL
jgi:hypothetical protein